MNGNYWPWWLGGALLATVAILFPLLAGATLGVSGALARILNWRGDKQGSAPAPAAESTSPPSEPAPLDACGTPATVSKSGPNRAANLAFLLSVVLGGALAGWVGGNQWGQTKVSPEFHRLFGHGVQALLVLFGGGLLVGFGTRWSGGCTSGHGLSGVGRLQPASLIATGVFFGVAIGVSFLLERILK